MRPKGLENWNDVDTVLRNLDEFPQGTLIDKKELGRITRISHVGIPKILNSCGLSSSSVTYSIEEIKQRFLPAMAMLLEGKTHEDIRTWANESFDAVEQQPKQQTTELEALYHHINKASEVVADKAAEQIAKQAAMKLGQRVMKIFSLQFEFLDSDVFAREVHLQFEGLEDRANILDAASIPGLKRISPAPLDDDIDLLDNNDEEQL